MLYDLALRRESVVSLDMEHVDREAATILVQIKGRTERVRRSLPDETKQALEQWLRYRGDSPGPVFVNFSRASKQQRLSGRSVHRIVQELGKRLGMTVRPHGLRHTAITAALDATGGNVRAVQKFAGHADVRVIERYDDCRQDMAGQVARRVAATV
jgi:integrase/recombinase XerC